MQDLIRRSNGREIWFKYKPRLLPGIYPGRDDRYPVPAFDTYRESVLAVGGKPQCRCVRVSCAEPGDVVMCPDCGKWYDYQGCDISPARAAARAREPMDAYDCLDALDGAAERMEIQTMEERAYQNG